MPRTRWVSILGISVSAVQERRQWLLRRPQCRGQHLGVIPGPGLAALPHTLKQHGRLRQHLLTRAFQMAQQQLLVLGCPPGDRACRLYATYDLLGLMKQIGLYRSATAR